MARPREREHYIPLRRSDLVNLLCGQMPYAQATQFRRFCDLLCDRVHIEFYRLLEQLKNDYAPFDPDADTQPLKPVEGAARFARAEGLFAVFDRLLTRANYVRMTDQEVLDCQAGSSYWGVNMSVDLGAFERFALYVRGRIKSQRVLRGWRTLFRRRVMIIDEFQRLVLILQQRDHPRLGPGADTRNVYLKLFKQIPTIDLEMLIPGARLKMPTLERGKLGVSILSGLAIIGYQVVKVFFFAAQAVSAFALWPLTIAALGYGYRQYAGYQFSLRTYNLKLAQNLYFQNLDNNAGVIYRLLDSAEEQECRESILAYYYLLIRGGDAGITAAELDQLVEAELERTAGVRVDFEVDDALRKLAAIGFLNESDGRCRAIPLEAALARLAELPAEPVFTKEVMSHARPLGVGAGGGN